MKWFLLVLIFLVSCTPIIFIGKGVDHLDIMKDRYKRALDAGVSTAARAVAYQDDISIGHTAAGFGIEKQHANNIEVDKDNATIWFYRVFYGNLGIQEDEAAQAHLRTYMPLKAIAGFDRLMIANMNDEWIVEKEYLIEHNGIEYHFTLSDQVKKSGTETWGRDLDFGITPAKRQTLVNRFIRNELNQFLADRENHDSNYRYYINIAENAEDLDTENISGVSYIVMVEGLPLPTLNPWRREKFYAFALGGSEIGRR